MELSNVYYCDKGRHPIITPKFLKTANIKGQVTLGCKVPRCKGKVTIGKKTEPDNTNTDGRMDKSGMDSSGSEEVPEALPEGS